LPPPAFWRTRYFAFDVLPRRPGLDPLEIRRIIAPPEHRTTQADGRVRLYGFSESLGCYLRVVLLSDGETVHNAFPDESFAP
jgi:hypothetical protein